MQGETELALLAELGVGFAGFVAIFLIFARRDGRFSPADSLRVRSMIMSSFLVVFYALIPLVLALHGVSGSDLWRISTLTAIVVATPIVIHIARFQLSLAPGDRAEVGLLHSIFSWGLSGLIVALLVANASGAFSGSGPALYVSAIVCLLGIATSNFVTIALKRLL